MPVVRRNPRARLALVIFYQLDIPLSPRIMARNFPVDEDDARHLYSELERHGYLEQIEEDVFALTEKGRRNAEDQLRQHSRGGQSRAASN